MKAHINSGMATIPIGRIVKGKARTLSLHPKFTDMAALAAGVSAGFTYLTGALGHVRVTAKGVTAAGKLALRSRSVEGNEDIDIGTGDSVVISRNSFRSVLTSAKSSVNFGMAASIEIDLILDNACELCVDKDTGLRGISRGSAPVDGKVDVYDEVDTDVLVEFAESTATPGRWLCSNAAGKARYYDEMADAAADRIGQVKSPTIETIGGLKYIRIDIDIQSA